MILRLLHALLLAALLFLHGAAAAASPQAWAYAGWWLPDGWRTVELQRLDRLLFFELKVSASGTIAERHGWPEQWEDLRAAAKRHAVPLDLTLTLLNAKEFDKLFSSPAAVERLLEEATALANGDGVAGLQLDFEVYEALRPAALQNARAFVRDLAARLRQQSPARSISVFLPVGGQAQLYDAATLAHADHVVLQGYDAHWPTSKAAGPLAPLDGGEAVTWKKAVALASDLHVPPDRMLLGFPLFGYEWPVKTKSVRSETTGPAQSASFAPLASGPVAGVDIDVQHRVTRYGAVHEPVSASSYYRFRNEHGRLFEGWFEDWWSLNRKCDYLKQEKVRGIAFFMLGYDGGQLIGHYLQHCDASAQRNVEMQRNSEMQNNTEMQPNQPKETAHGF